MLNTSPVHNRLRTDTLKQPPADRLYLYTIDYTRLRAAAVRIGLSDVSGLVPIHQQPIDAVRV